MDVILILQIKSTSAYSILIQIRLNKNITKGYIQFVVFQQKDLHEMKNKLNV